MPITSDNCVTQQYRHPVPSTRGTQLLFSIPSNTKHSLTLCFQLLLYITVLRITLTLLYQSLHQTKNFILFIFTITSQLLNFYLLYRTFNLFPLVIIFQPIKFLLNYLCEKVQRTFSAIGKNFVTITGIFSSFELSSSELLVRMLQIFFVGQRRAAINFQ